MTTKNTGKVVGAKKALAKHVEKQEQVRKLSDETDEKIKVCADCQTKFTSPYSGKKYCDKCSAEHKKARRKLANKRRIGNRKAELIQLRDYKKDMEEALESGKLRWVQTTPKGKKVH